MSGAPSNKPQSEKELKTARTLNTVATIGAGHAIVASTPAEWRAKVPGRKKLVSAGWLNEPQAHVKKPLPPKLARLMPKSGTSAKIAAGTAAGGWLTLHGGELAGDIMARRSINNQISQLPENKGKVDSVKKNDQSMISKAEGSVSRNGHGKALDATGSLAMAGGGGYALSRIPGFKEASRDEKLTRALAPSRNRFTLDAQRDIIDAMKRKSRAGNKVAAGGLLAAAGLAEHAHSKKVNKSLVEVAKGANTATALGATPTIGSIAAPIYNATQARDGRKAAVAGRTYGSMIAYGTGAAALGTGALYANAARKGAKPIVNTAAKPGISRAAATFGHKPAIAAGLGVLGGLGYGARRANQNAVKRGDIVKAYRRFDPEADRQRRAGLYTGVGVLGAGLAGREAANHFTTKAKDVQGVTVRGVVAKPKKGKLGLGLAAVAGASGAFGAHSYKSGLSTRNQPWT